MTRSQIARWVSSAKVSNFIMAVVIFNAALLGMQTSQKLTEKFGAIFDALDTLCLAIFVVELLLKLYAYRGKFFTSGWNVFDFVIVGIALAPGSGGLSVLRALRAMRLMRVVSASPSLRRVVEGFISALPGMASVFLLMAMIFYVASVIAAKTFGQAFPEWFGTLGASAYTLFQVMTLESWSMGIVRPVMEAFPDAWLFFVPFILMTTFAVMNLVVGLIVNSMESAHDEVQDQETADHRDVVLGRLKAIEDKLDQLARK